MDEETDEKPRRLASEPTDDMTELARRLRAALTPSEALLKAIADANKGFQVKLPSLPKPATYQPKIESPNFENANAHASARTLLKSLNRYYTDWAKEIDEEYQVAIYVVLANGAVIRANQLIEEGFNGIAVEGELNGMSCLLLLQQSSLQFLCVAEKIEPETEARKIGFVYGESK